MSRWLGLGVLLVLTSGIAGCGGFSPEDAKARCDQEREARNVGGSTSCVDDAAYEECVSAYEDCGEDVTVNNDTCPVHYSCDEEDLAQQEG